MKPTRLQICHKALELMNDNVYVLDQNADDDHDVLYYGMKMDIVDLLAAAYNTFAPSQCFFFAVPECTEIMGEDNLHNIMVYSLKSELGEDYEARVKRILTELINNNGFCNYETREQFA